MAATSDDALLHLAAIVEWSQDAIMSASLDGRITTWNPAAARIFGYSAEEAIGQSTRLIVPPGREDEQRESLAIAAGGEVIRHFDTVRQRKGGELVPVSLTLSPIRDADGKIVGVSAIARDVSERRRHEHASRRLAAIVESSDDAIVGKNLDGIVTSWNQAAERMFGYTATEMIGRSIRTIVPADRQGEEDHVLSRVRNGLKVDHFDTVRQRKDGSMIPISLTVSPIRDEFGVVTGASKVARDISGRQAIESERTRLLAVAQGQAVENARLYAGLEAASRLKDEFLATLSHELRTPLNAILGYARMLRAGLMQPPQQHRAVETIERNAMALTQIVEDVLDVSRIVSGKIRLHVQPLDLAEIVAHAIEAVGVAAQAKAVKLDLQRDAQVVRLSGDPDRLQQVIWNVLSNAVKFTDRGGRVDVAVREGDARVEVIVRDTGSGIAPAFLPHIFERFRQADSSISRETGGLGLGLSIARELVEMHGGTITAESDGPGKGSTFRIVLPVALLTSPVDTTEPSLHPVHPASTSVTTPDLVGVKLLAVDDDPDALRLLREILEITGASVAAVGSAVEALDLIASWRPDVLIADIGMPRMDGFELIRRIREHPDVGLRDIPAAALTAYARSEDRLKALSNGFQIHLTKPIDPGELMTAVARLARRQ